MRLIVAVALGSEIGRTCEYEVQFTLVFLERGVVAYLFGTSLEYFIGRFVSAPHIAIKIVRQIGVFCDPKIGHPVVRVRVRADIMDLSLITAGHRAKNATAPSGTRVVDDNPILIPKVRGEAEIEILCRGRWEVPGGAEGKTHAEIIRLFRNPLIRIIEKLQRFVVELPTEFLFEQVRITVFGKILIERWLLTSQIKIISGG